ncbi:hypothetical protein [Bacillus manliponensis]|uniref:hypothetical protein n=1 Tax=Bacillus manliponensis TaxID=574376 RepID=UPI003516BC0F
MGIPKNVEAVLIVETANAEQKSFISKITNIKIGVIPLQLKSTKDFYNIFERF